MKLKVEVLFGSIKINSYIYRVNEAGTQVKLK